MASTQKEILTEMTRMSALFDPPHPKTLPDGEVNPKYAAALGIYLETLEPFHPWEVKAGIKLALQNHKYKKWPLPAELQAWCIQAQREMKPPPPPREAPKLEDKRPELSAEDRERIGLQLQVMRKHAETHRQGEPFGMTLAECKAKAAALLAGRISRRSQIP